MPGRVAKNKTQLTTKVPVKPRDNMPLKIHIDEQPSLNMTPMIDIVFLLIIFFMVGTKFTELERKIGL